MTGSGNGSRYALSRCIIWRCWNVNRGRWIMRGRWRAGRCRRASGCYAGAWKRSGRGEVTREYIRVLRLLEKHSLADLRGAVEKALAVGALTRDAIAQFLFPREDWRLSVFSLDGHPHLRTVPIAPPNLQAYRDLLGGGR